MKKGDRIIWDSGFGYEIGYFIKSSDNNMYNTYLVDICTGIITRECMHSKNEIKPYNSENLAEMQKKYKYIKEFSKHF